MWRKKAKPYKFAHLYEKSVGLIDGFPGKRYDDSEYSQYKIAAVQGKG